MASMQSLISQDQRRVLCSGWLSKRGHKRTNWTERYFILASEGSGLQQRATLYYYVKPWKVGDTHEPKGAVPLHGGTFALGDPVPGSKSFGSAKHYFFTYAERSNQTQKRACHRQA